MSKTNGHQPLDREGFMQLMFRKKLVEIPDSGGKTLLVREFTGQELDLYGAQATDRTAARESGGSIAYQRIRQSVVAKGLINEDGSHLFTESEEDIAAMSTIPGRVLDLLYDWIMFLSGLTLREPGKPVGTEALPDQPELVALKNAPGGALRTA